MTVEVLEGPRVAVPFGAWRPVRSAGVRLAYERRLARIQQALNRGSLTEAYRLAAGLASSVAHTGARDVALDFALVLRDLCEGDPVGPGTAATRLRALKQALSS